jgi:heme exporter protein D
MSSEFLSMGGYAVYVWGSFGAAALVLIWNVLSPLLQRKAVLRRLVEDSEQPSERNDD